MNVFKITYCAKIKKLLNFLNSFEINELKAQLQDKNIAIRELKQLIAKMKGRTKKPTTVHISTRKPKQTVNQSIATPHRRTVASESNIQKPRSTLRKLYEHCVLEMISCNDSWIWRSGSNLEVAFQKSTCYVRDLNGNDLLTSSRGTDLYSITL
ncbi:hypothetical protein Tco_0348374 [Tanacetum coccineum]